MHTEIESVHGTCDKLPWKAVKCSPWMSLCLLKGPRAGPRGVGVSARDPSSFSSLWVQQTGARWLWELSPHGEVVHLSRCSQESSKASFWTTLPGHGLGNSLKVWEQRCCPIQARKIISKAVRNKKGRSSWGSSSFGEQTLLLRRSGEAEPRWRSSRLRPNEHFWDPGNGGVMHDLKNQTFSSKLQLWLTEAYF